MSPAEGAEGGRGLKTGEFEPPLRNRRLESGKGRQQEQASFAVG